MKKYNLKPNKALGQNFLIDEEVLEDIVKAADVSNEDLVIEIGPGLGTLTNLLLEKAKKVICIELDERMLAILQERFTFYNNFELIHEDVLKVDLKKIIKEERENSQIQKVKIVANLPYYITTPIIMKLLEERLDIDSITVMIQKEVAKRLTAIPGKKDTGAITYTVSYYANPKEVRIVPSTAFIPAPDVDSEVITLEIRKEPQVKVLNEKLFFSVIKASFMQRRKTLMNGLINGNISVKKEELENILKELGIDIRVRGENLSLEQFAQIADEIEKRK